MRKKTNEETGLREFSELLIRAALEEDIGSGDITTGAIVRKGCSGAAEFIAKEDMVVAGLFIPEMVFKRLDKKSRFRARFKDGGHVRKGEVIATVSGTLSALLTGERVALNFLQRLSGIATRTNEFVKRLKDPEVRLLDTRKTTPCLRALEKYAVKAGGGTNHRFGLFDCVLIKDNHIKAAGSVAAAVQAVRKKYNGSLPIEVEVTDLKETKEAVASGADIIMLDNMDLRRIRQATREIGGRAFVEVSGNINLDNVGAVSVTGVDFISVGGLTHSARAVDISMEVVSLCGAKARKSR
ncbi:MAG TPA: carboxylating nicotinate-nucleotide diphosphorylase [Deltaproteobacteria bacterium]|nr:MAG: nicotinate-nucleotide diphosphorylase (carboxylating) [Deltaproteobacteria bacterium GWA2_55_82]OGQ62815.1 MAG: nicotinate-nucleotide diphosphorylase (carboxylating) [Deltaproteobacteria bacterium RIFCSPLOWO2_02_FULL_55_12]OIJ73536.1 MAG: nicotinate-nucleotide diphosphorylase (carboxylating) [Deltaproteobacteria bacterium GWC2_55_46]HBG46269.1 carboxylating nicotinate-nucleotide diphosphorylase [Deltaproteobacteria bacterium]HCY10176.1 carboxylating nicotinate-nucleotide diphosphorylase